MRLQNAWDGVGELAVWPPLLPMPILPSTGLRAVRTVIPHIKENYLFLSVEKAREMVRTPTLIVLNSNEICHAQEKGKL